MPPPQVLEALGALLVVEDDDEAEDGDRDGEAVVTAQNPAPRRSRLHRRSHRSAR